MSYYFIAQITVNDTKEYQKYLDKAETVFRRYEGEYLVVDDTPEVLEGTWDCTRTVVIRFSSKDDLKAWYYSQDYQLILKYRLKAAVCNTIMAKGLNLHDS